MDSISLDHLQSAGFRKFVPLIEDQGDTGAASRIFIEARDLAGVVDPDHVGPLRVRLCNSGTFANSTNGTIAAAAGSALLEALTANKDLVISEIRSASATRTLTISGVVIHGQTVTIGGRVYQFTGGAAASGSNIAVDIEADMVAAQGTLTMDTQPTALDTVTVGTRTYVWVANGTADNPGEISIGANLAAAKVNFVAAINGTDSVNTANSLISAAAFDGDDCVLTARIAGTVGNDYVTTESFTAGTNVFDAATLGDTTLGVDCAAADAVTALVAAITGDASAVVTAADGAGDTVVCTAKTAGVAGNDIVATEAMANGAWGGSGFTGGVDAVPGTYCVDLTDASAETVTLRIGPAPQGACFGDYATALNVTHAAP